MNHRSGWHWLLAASLLVCGVVGCQRHRTPRQHPTGATETRPPEPDPPTLAELRQASPTQLTRHGPAPQPFEPVSPPDGVREIIYRSGDLDLKAWYGVPDSDAETHPAVVYFHSGYAFGASDFDDARVFLDAGFAVLTPMLRGENGNPGSFEMLWGEMDDGIAAAQWLANQPEINTDQIYTFGHSIGGGVSALLALAGDDVPIRHGGSCGGLYPPFVFAEWADTAPFDTSNPTENALRTLKANIKSMRRDHYAYAGIADPLAPTLRQTSSGRLYREFVLGDHFTSLGPAMIDYATRIFREAFGESAQLPSHLRPISWHHPDTVPTESVIPDAPMANHWNVKNDPFPATIEHYRGQVLCPVTIVDQSRAESRGDFAFPYGFEPVAKLTEHPNQAQQLGSPMMFDLRTMKVTADSGTASFEVLKRNIYSVAGNLVRSEFRWPKTNEVIQQPPGGVKLAASVYCVSPGQQYVAAFSSEKELLVWQVDTRRLVGWAPLPSLPGLDREYLAVAEMGFAPDGAEFAAVLGTPGEMRLLNWHWESGAITANYPVKTAWGGNRSSRRQHRTQLQFLENGQGWMTEFGRNIIDRQTGRRRGSLSFGADLHFSATPRLLAGNRMISVFLQDKSSLFRHQVAAIDLAPYEP